ncbi:hypothetical protein [Kineococcus terrestris]|uniref:hypothetical protein n=1 Tax=Kineococcus terrestris TaxID=2044856 RepID=UPI0034DB761A
MSATGRAVARPARSSGRTRLLWAVLVVLLAAAAFPAWLGRWPQDAGETYDATGLWIGTASMVAIATVLGTWRVGVWVGPLLALVAFTVTMTWVVMSTGDDPQTPLAVAVFFVVAAMGISVLAAVTAAVRYLLLQRRRSH